jgi:hypothetical protein
LAGESGELQERIHENGNFSIPTFVHRDLKSHINRLSLKHYIARLNSQWARVASELARDFAPSREIAHLCAG